MLFTSALHLFIYKDYVNLLLPCLTIKPRHCRKRVHNINNTIIIDPLSFHQSVTLPISSLLIVSCLITALTLLFASFWIYTRWQQCRQSAMLF